MPRAHLTRQEGKFNFPLINKEITKLKLSFKVLKLFISSFHFTKNLFICISQNSNASLDLHQS